MIERLGLQAWRAFDNAHPAPTFFARPAWAQALAEIYPRLQPVLLRVQARGLTPILIPMMEERNAARLRRFTGFPLGGYTCFLREDGAPASGEQAEHALRELGRFAHSASMVPWPLGPVPRAPFAHTHETAVVDLTGGLEHALAGVDGTYRRMAGQAARRGVECALDTAPDAAQTYYELLRESAKRWGIPEPLERRALIEALLRYGGKDVEIWFARAQGQPIAGGVVFYGASELFFWSAAMLTEFGRLRPSNALNFALLRAAAARGMQWYNLGSSEGLPGVARFKKDLGAREIRYREIDLAQFPIRVARTLRSALNSRTHRMVEHAH